MLGWKTQSRKLFDEFRSIIVVGEEKLCPNDSIGIDEVELRKPYEARRIRRSCRDALSTCREEISDDTKNRFWARRAKHVKNSTLASLEESSSILRSTSTRRRFCKSSDELDRRAGS